MLVLLMVSMYELRLRRRDVRTTYREAFEQ
jgi:hypothetical protein